MKKSELRTGYNAPRNGNPVALPARPEALTLNPNETAVIVVDMQNAYVAHDAAFYDALPKLFPHADAKPWFTSSSALAKETALRNGALQAAYFILAARALGVDVGPMSGFDRPKVDDVFLPGTSWKSDMLINLGHGDPSKLAARLPRLSIDEACLFL